MSRALREVASQEESIQTLAISRLATCARSFCRLSCSNEDEVPTGFWRKSVWTLHQLFGHPKRTRKQSLAWKREKRQIVEGGKKVLVCLLAIDIMLFAFWMMGKTKILQEKAEVDRPLGDWEGFAEGYSRETEDEWNNTDVYIEDGSENGTIATGAGEYEAESELSCAASPGGSPYTGGYQGQRDLKKNASRSSCKCNCNDKCKDICKKAKQSPEERRREKKLLARRRRVERRRLTATCKDKNVLRRPIPSDQRAGYFMEYVYKPWDADSEFPHKPCSAPGCRWLRSFLTNGNDPAVMAAARQHSPCDDFYRHVCEARPRTPYQRGSHKLMDEMRGLLKTRGKKKKKNLGKLPYAHASLFKRCLEGRDVVIKDHITYDWEERKMRGCPIRVPTVPLKLSERFFRTRTGSRRTMPEFFQYIAKLTTNLSMDDRVAPPEKGYVAREWVPGACQWVARAARCHYFMDLQMTDDDHLNRYQLYWKIMYFSPLMGSMTQRIYEEVYTDPPKPRVQACFNLLEDHYYMNATKLARRVLKETVPRPHDVLSRVGWFIRWALRDRVPTWLARRNGTRIAKAAASKDGALDKMAVAAAALKLDFNESVAREVRRHLEALDTDLMHSSRREEAPEVSLFAQEGRYTKKRKNVVVPPGLLAVMINATPSLDPIMTTLVGAPILRVLLPHRGGPYSWRWASERRLRGVTDCVQKKMASSKAVAEQVVTESALLDPLFDAFRRNLADDVGLGHRLNPRYSNSELPYVLWALGHCGDPMGDVIVNGAVNNSAHFSKTFGCTRGDRLWSEDKCPFWA
ncbi:uncharacterized protein LOC144143164 [Haemaphysalis longicornis]